MTLNCVYKILILFVKDILLRAYKEIHNNTRHIVGTKNNAFDKKNLFSIAGKMIVSILEH